MNVNVLHKSINSNNMCDNVCNKRIYLRELLWNRNFMSKVFPWKFVWNYHDLPLIESTNCKFNLLAERHSFLLFFYWNRKRRTDGGDHAVDNSTVWPIKHCDGTTSVPQFFVSETDFSSSTVNSYIFNYLFYPGINIKILENFNVTISHFSSSKLC